MYIYVYIYVYVYIYIYINTYIYIYMGDSIGGVQDIYKRFVILRTPKNLEI